MADKKVTDILLDRVKYFINAIENGKYEPTDYEFTIILKKGIKSITLSDTFDTRL